MTVMRPAGSEPGGESGGEYDPFAPEVLEDPAAAHRALRERCPVHHHTGFGENGFYTLSRHADVAALFGDVGLWSSEWGQGPIFTKEGGLRSDPPEHTVYRRLVTAAFTARRTAALEDWITATAGDLIDGFAADGRADLCAAYAVPLPVLVIAKILGVPAAGVDEFKEWSDQFMAGQNAADPAVQGAARAKIDGYFSEVLEERRAVLASAGPDALPDDLLTALLTAEHDGRPFTTEELLPLILLLLVGGNETTTSLIANAVWRLLDLGLWDDVRARPELVDAAVEESLRYDPPVLGLFRTNTRPVIMHGVEIPEGSKAHGLYASANRDPEAWDDPDTFRLDRDLADLRRRHMSFGAGQYLCPGAALARLEARISLRLLGERLPGLRLDGAPTRVDSFMMWGPSNLPITWSS
ncbi:cytochrome P450 [Actinomadura decatromicini]|uniref:Cytochrome P450 n=1 Tax=Actinomadura decatromicini TaxID=2604572 RepID=A0A5D3FFP6_9ACTN|nr:cytochrome P450 [Actinomadura decatromicini]TYK46802.1 cytochrome P450 [Actinomadura decatromicini]